MDLTPRKEITPWWTLLRCCNPSDEVDKENEGDAKTGAISASTSATTDCPGKVVTTYHIMLFSWCKYFLSDDELFSQTRNLISIADDSSEPVSEAAEKPKQRVSFSTPVESDAIITVDASHNTNAEPTLIDSDDDDDDDGDASTVSADSKNSLPLKNSDYYSLPFRTFLFYMVLRNIIGVDYLSDRVFSGGKQPLMITSGVSSPNGKSKQDEVVAGSD
ncbi:hypothetical protein ACHAXS_004039 [Conticribra weissflogii]